ncbi:MAG: Nitroreductase [Synergistales bacterium 53_16]|jgi:nitroreductase|nr:MAG: Nitroreductase [Synergistales bacterium 53_16]
MLDLLRKRRSIRKFHDRPLAEEQVEILEESILRTPSARNLRSWEFIMVDKRDLLQKLSEVRGSSSAFIAGASAAIVVMGNEKTADTWVEDASIAAIIAQMTATSLGLGSCWAHIRNREHKPGITAEEYVKDLLGIPEQLRVVCIIAIGHPAEEKGSLAVEDLPYRKIHRNRF